MNAAPKKEIRAETRKLTEKKFNTININKKQAQ